MAAPRAGKRAQAWYERLTLFRAVRAIVAVAVMLGVLGASLARWLEPETFTSIGLAYWWAVTTITTVGYGDVVPKTTEGRLVGTVLMLTGLSLIPILSSVTVSILVAKHGQARFEEDAIQLEEQSARLERIEERLAQLQGPPQR